MMRELALLLAPLTLANAQPPAVTSEAYLKAALVVKTFDHYAAACNRRRAFNADEARQINTWQRDNGVEKIRARLPELEKFPDRKLQLEQAAATTVKLATARGARECAAAVALTRSPEAQFAKVAPQLLRDASEPSSPATPKPSREK